MVKHLSNLEGKPTTLKFGERELEGAVMHYPMVVQNSRSVFSTYAFISLDRTVIPLTGRGIHNRVHAVPQNGTPRHLEMSMTTYSPETKYVPLDERQKLILKTPRVDGVIA